LHLQCCDGIPEYDEVISKGVYATDTKGVPGSVLKDEEMPVAILMKVEEGMLCNYKATACSSLLCVRTKSSSTTTTIGQDSSGSDVDKKNSVVRNQYSLLSVMKAINSTCLSKLEEWWTYELCFGSGIRQVCNMNCIIITIMCDMKII